ncbi:hypothetical protein CVT25_001622 [Psilocybe cyanescens]|uniref:NAD(P)-binding protein n=1 Tax=Psilocybe cyanescens TaxID=93625 RepID=A0A409WQ98_PSICY|nr:hypothetical protein CVT25_001622 [Psilocybe cyanescens]
MKPSFIQHVKDQWSTLPPVAHADLTGKVVVVIGANVGLGFEASKHFARMNPGKLILACRSKEKGDAALAQIKQETGCTTAEVWIIDLSSFASVISFADRLETECGRLDILVENAAIAVGNVVFTADNWESALQTNVLSGTLLALLLLPRMLETAEKHNTTPRLAVVTSGLHYSVSFDEKFVKEPNFLRRYAHKDFRRPGTMDVREYSETKLLNVLFARALSDRLHGKPVIVNSLDPGFCYSSLRRHTTGFKTLMYKTMECALARTSEEGSRQIVFAAIGDEENKNELRGAYLTMSKVQEPSDWVIGEDGQRAQNKIWNEFIEELSEVEPRVQQIVQNYLTEPFI